MITRFAAADVGPAELDKLCLPAVRGQRRQDLLQEDFRVPALARASMAGNGFHGIKLRRLRFASTAVQPESLNPRPRRESF